MREPLRAARTLRALVVAAFVGASTGGTAAADPAERCIEAHESSQRLRHQSRLRAAREALLTCADASCPSQIRNDCTGWLGEVEATTPTIVVAARDPSGGDLGDVRVTMDGAPLATRLDGKALAVDPGPHRFRFEKAGEPAVEQSLVILEGERNRLVVVTVGRPPPPPRVDVERPVPALVWILGGVGVAGLGVGAGFFVSARSSESDLVDSGCKPLCSRDDAESVDRRDTIALVAGSVGGAALIGAIVAYVTRPSIEVRRPGKSGFVLGPSASGFSF